MDQGLHFISGLPRSGSTLLSAILRQNPRFHAMMTSPVGGIYLAMLEATSRKNETAVFINQDQKRSLLTGVFENYYHEIGQQKVVFDTNRSGVRRCRRCRSCFRREVDLLRAPHSLDHGQRRAADQAQCL